MEVDADETLNRAGQRETRAYVGRFAPSPTGPLHFGSLVAAVASYVDARARQGRWLLRIEDVDQPRCTLAAETEILRQLGAYGFESDGEIVRQSARKQHYDLAITSLQSAGKLFACTCTRKTLESAPRNCDGETIYPGTCRNISPAAGEAAQRLRVDTSRPIVFHDRACGMIEQLIAAEVGDFVLRRADGITSYQLAVVVDDGLQEITHVVRGEDLLMNTPRQIYLQRLLGYPTPCYLHVPLVRNIAGEKLSKQTLAAAISIDAAPATLRAAWRFLGQEDFGEAATVAAFWSHATKVWDPRRLIRTGQS